MGIFWTLPRRTREVKLNWNYGCGSDGTGSEIPDGPDCNGCTNSSETGERGVGDEKGDHSGGSDRRGEGAGDVAGSRQHPSVSSSSNSLSLATASITRHSKLKPAGSSGTMVHGIVPGAHGENVLPERVCKHK